MNGRRWSELCCISVTCHSLRSSVKPGRPHGLHRLRGCTSSLYSSLYPRWWRKCIVRYGSSVRLKRECFFLSFLLSPCIAGLWLRGASSSVETGLGCWQKTGNCSTAAQHLPSSWWEQRSRIYIYKQGCLSGLLLTAYLLSCYLFYFKLLISEQLSTTTHQFVEKPLNKSDYTKSYIYISRTTTINRLIVNSSISILACPIWIFSGLIALFGRKLNVVEKINNTHRVLLLSMLIFAVQ